MNRNRLKTRARELEALLKKYAHSDSEADSLLRSLSHQIEEAKNEDITMPMEWRDISGSWLFLEGTLRKYPDLEAAFAQFRIEVTGA